MRDNSLQSRTFDWLRFPCACLVVLAHSFISVPQTELLSIYDTAGILFSHVIATTSVPIFTLISAFLFYKGLEEWNCSVYVKKIKKRIRTILMPYLLWNIVVVLFLVTSRLLDAKIDGIEFNVLDFLKEHGYYLIFWDNNNIVTTHNIFGWKVYVAVPINYPFWFLRDLMICFLFAPVYCKLVRLLKGYGVLAVFLLCLLRCQIPYTGFNIELCFYFYLGAYLAINGSDVVECCREYRTLSHIFAIIFLPVSVGLFRNEVAFYSILSLFHVFGVSSLFCIASGLVEKGDVTNNAFLSRSTFFIYASHSCVLSMTAYLFKLVYNGSNEWVLLGIYFSRWFLSILLILFLFYCFEKYLPKTTYILTGRR